MTLRPTAVQAYILLRLTTPSWAIRRLSSERWWLCDARKAPRLRVREQTMGTLIRAGWVKAAEDCWELSDEGRLLTSPELARRRRFVYLGKRS